MARTYLVLGASGMLGNACLRALATGGDTVIGTVRKAGPMHAHEAIRDRIIEGVDAENFDSVVRAVAEVKPDLVVNCIGMVKQLSQSKDPLVALPLNALFPHRLHHLCRASGSRLIHVSTDCVFSGEQGMYVETDRPDADDLYGVSKRLGELEGPGAVTLRTSIIGHELGSSRSLIDWFLSQEGEVEGYTEAIYTGLPTVELAKVIRDVVAPREDLQGLYHVASDRISKYELLKLVAEVYGKSVAIKPSGRVRIDRSLDASAFRDATGYVAPAWPELVRRMREFG